jgi:hypothetical protein
METKAMFDLKNGVDVHGSRVFLEKRADQTMTEGGLLLAGSGIKVFEIYMVVASGVDKFKFGDEVICQSMGPQQLQEELFGDRIFYVNDEDIVATIRPSLKELCEPLAPSGEHGVPNMDPDCQAIDETQEGGTHLECPTKEGE